MLWSTGRLSRALEVQSVVRLLVGERGPEKLEGPAATPRGGGHSVCGAETRDLTTLTRCDANGSADMAKRTRLPGLSDSETQPSGVKITPPPRLGPVTSTPTVA
jgi:hypothetical protein